MDWSKTKTIFIIVFSILNVLLYSLFLNRNADIGNVEVMGQASMEEVLKQENISYKLPPFVDKEASFVSADVVDFNKESLKDLKGQRTKIVSNNLLKSTITDKITLDEANDDDFKTFLSQYVLNGKEYVLWNVVKDEHKAFFFQQFDGRPIYYSPSAMLVITWGEDEHIQSYEQRMLKDFANFNKKDLLSPLDIIGSLASRGLLKQNSEVTDVKMGYSTLVRLTETQVFAPTWDVQVKLENGEKEHHFLSANEGKVIEFQLNGEDEKVADEEQSE
ncbi:two-component system regulatory protein YycI [Sporosarcina aquimarina]|uniref:Two-component system regulatory protein YycI n=1 Tax=Sporosarcina aquimarina TaxID=114975 RepID=A0ABU4G4C0_9BACL|nr:two-component system regulatory protein YycI [Sporosarcina aquimarina]MDW0111227.1 two-component system regulatory protein YycI [Sporosarcina aquimarina]